MCVQHNDETTYVYEYVLDIMEHSWEVGSNDFRTPIDLNTYFFVLNRFWRTILNNISAG